MTDRLFRFSQTSTFLESRRLYRLKYIDNLERDWPAGERPMQTYDVGSIGHYGLQAQMRGHSHDFCTAAMRAYVRSNGLVDNPDKKIYAQDGYNAWERNWHAFQENNPYAGYEVVAVEKRLYVDMGIINGDQVTLTFEPDVILRDKFSLTHVVDWKFVADYGTMASYASENRQGLTYALGLQQLGQMPTSFTLHQIHRKPPKTKAVEPFNKVTTFISPEVLKKHETYLRRLLEDMVKLHQEVEAGDDSGAYPSPKWSCRNMCGMFEICCGALTKDEQEIADIKATRYRTREQGF